MKLVIPSLCTQNLMSMHPAPGRNILHNPWIGSNYQKFITFSQIFDHILGPDHGQRT